MRSSSVTVNFRMVVYCGTKIVIFFLILHTCWAFVSAYLFNS